MREESGVGEEEALPLFETKEARFRGAYKVFASTIFAAICLILVYRLTNIPTTAQGGRWAWIAAFVSEIAFGVYWIITQSVRWRIAFQSPFKERLLHRFFNLPPTFL